MGEKSNQITREIEETRAELGSNLEDLEHKVKSLTDWREQFQRSPLTMIGLALGVGVLLAKVIGGKHGSRAEAWQTGNGHSSATNHQVKKAYETWDTIKGALVGVAAGTVQNLLKDAIPGFHEQFQKAQKRDHPELSSS